MPLLELFGVVALALLLTFALDRCLRYIRSRSSLPGSATAAAAARWPYAKADVGGAARGERSLPDPTPLTDLDLASETTRNYIYANRTVRYPYYQVRRVPAWEACAHRAASGG